VRANAVAPVAIRTSDNVRSMGENARYVEREDLARVVAWLCDDASRPTTGQVIAL
jgi:NAD(P)-dependent dehydrogenase (short-subunit alcohol dehydrogenase family)